MPLKIDPKSVENNRQTITKLQNFLTGVADGTLLTWLEIEQKTGVSMKTPGPGRPLCAKALRKMHRPYETLWGEGIRLSAPSTAMTILHGRVIRIDGAVRSASRTQKHLQERHLEQMTGDEQRKMLMAAGLFGAIRAYASESKSRIFK